MHFNDILTVYSAVQLICHICYRELKSQEPIILPQFSFRHFSVEKCHDSLAFMKSMLDSLVFLKRNLFCLV